MVAKDTVYHIPHFSSCRVVQLIYELDARDRVDIQTITLEQLRTDPAVVAKNPGKTVPLYSDGAGFDLAESGAILTYMLERYDRAHRLSPPPLGAEASADERERRANFLFWLHYGPGSVFPVADGIFLLLVNVPPAQRNHAELKKLVASWTERIVPTLRRALRDGRRYILGEEFSAADISIGYDLVLAKLTKVDELFEDPLIQGYYSRLSERKSFRELYLPLPDWIE